MLKAIIFDYDGVIRHLDESIADTILADHKLEIDDFFGKLWGNEHVTALVEGRINRDVWWERLQNQHPELEVMNSKILWEVIFSHSELDYNLLEYINSLQDRYITAILSNADPISVKKIREEVEEYHFDYILSSSGFGIAKPNLEIFEQTFDTLSVKPEEVLFFDDSTTNVAAARSLGVHAYVYQGLEQVKEKVAELDS